MSDRLLILIVCLRYGQEANYPFSNTLGLEGQVVFIPAYRKCFCRAYKRKTANENLSQDNVEFHQSFKGVGVEEEIVFIPV